MLHELLARPARTFFTVAGIAIGILALTVVGSLAERLHAIVQHSVALNGDYVIAELRGAALGADGSGSERARLSARIRALPGVADVVPEVVAPYGDPRQGARFGPPTLVFAFPPAAHALQRGLFHVAAGRAFAPGERHVALIGPDFAAAEGTRIGEVIAVGGSSVLVVGELDKAFTIFDAAIVVPFPDGQGLLQQFVSPRATALPRDPVSAFLVQRRPGADASLLAQRINVIPGLRATDPVAVARAVGATIGVFDAIVFGAALIALIVGAFSVINTMTMAVTERTREIGIRKAIGATDGDVLLAFVGEAALIGLLGGLLGIGLGLALVAFVDARSAAGGNLELFAISPAVAGASLAFGVLLSALAGFVPALSAARLPPTVALRR